MDEVRAAPYMFQRFMTPLNPRPFVMSATFRDGVPAFGGEFDERGSRAVARIVSASRYVLRRRQRRRARRARA